jgi:hypothetical protein
MPSKIGVHYSSGLGNLFNMGVQRVGQNAYQNQMFDTIYEGNDRYVR